MDYNSLMIDEYLDVLERKVAFNNALNDISYLVFNDDSSTVSRVSLLTLESYKGKLLHETNDYKFQFYGMSLVNKDTIDGCDAKLKVENGRISVYLKCKDNFEYIGCFSNKNLTLWMKANEIELIGTVKILEDDYLSFKIALI